MALRRFLSVGLTLAALLMGSGARADDDLAGRSLAENSSGDRFLTLDLNQAALSPTPLGPPARFESVPVEAQAEAKAEIKTGPATAAPVRTAKVHPAPAQPARHRIAQRHTGSPLDAQASTPRPRIQLWYSCASGLCTRQR